MPVDWKTSGVNQGGVLDPAYSAGAAVGGMAQSVVGKLGGLLGRPSAFGEIDPHGNVANTAGQSNDFANRGERGFYQLGREGDAEREALRRLARGEDSYSAEQLRGSLQQNLAAQRSMAASAAPGNQAMAARTAAIQGGRMGAGLAGQQALAGIAERQAAQQSLMNALLQQRQQDLQASLGGRQNALQGYLGLEQARTGRYAADKGVPGTGEQLIGGAASVLGNPQITGKLFG